MECWWCLPIYWYCEIDHASIQYCGWVFEKCCVVSRHCFEFQTTITSTKPHWRKQVVLHFQHHFLGICLLQSSFHFLHPQQPIFFSDRVMFRSQIRCKSNRLTYGDHVLGGLLWEGWVKQVIYFQSKGLNAFNAPFQVKRHHLCIPKCQSALTLNWHSHLGSFQLFLWPPVVLHKLFPRIRPTNLACC